MDILGMQKSTAGRPAVDIGRRSSDEGRLDRAHPNGLWGDIGEDGGMGDLNAA